MKIADKQIVENPWWIWIYSFSWLKNWVIFDYAKPQILLK